MRHGSLQNEDPELRKKIFILMLKFNEEWTDSCVKKCDLDKKGIT